MHARIMSALPAARVGQGGWVVFLGEVGCYEGAAPLVNEGKETEADEVSHWRKPALATEVVREVSTGGLLWSATEVVRLTDA